jgi:acyl-CoA reductase-like NAD-dependent aldehyde dehydrogenase
MKLQTIDPRTQQPVGDVLVESTHAQIDEAVSAATHAFETWSATTGEERAQYLEALAQALESHRDALVKTADLECALGLPRLNGELDRTCFQLRRFAHLAKEGAAFHFTDDPAVAGAPPVGHPAMMKVRIPLGPVAVFAASNFPFAFSVLGGDTASALAAGCTVVVKAHPAHPQLSLQTLEIINQVQTQLHRSGVITMVQGHSFEIGYHLIGHPDICAGAFTGSTRGGAALQAKVHERARPIPFYGELGSINPIVALHDGLVGQEKEMAATLAGSIALGCGQFCTSPGVVLLIDEPAHQASNDLFVAELTSALKAQTPHAMLTPGIRHAFDQGVEKFVQAGAKTLTFEKVTSFEPKPFLGWVSAKEFLAHAALHDEVFGPACLLVRCASSQEAVDALHAVGGSLTVTLWGATHQTATTQALVRAASRIAGRVLFKSVPTGVAVCAAQQHGGPWPSSTAPMTTSVGDDAMDRFLRPVALQDFPAWVSDFKGRPI